MTTQSKTPRGPALTLLMPVAALLILLASACESTGDCVATYEFEGESRKPGYTRAECEAECDAIGRTLSCFFDGRGQTPLAMAERYDFGEERP